MRLGGDRAGDAIAERLSHAQQHLVDRAEWFVKLVRGALCGAALAITNFDQPPIFTIQFFQARRERVEPAGVNLGVLLKFGRQEFHERLTEP